MPPDPVSSEQPIDPKLRPVGHRVDQACHVCGIFDRHPRHHILAVDEAGQPEYIVRHFDCCADTGCPDGTCNDQLRDSNGAHGEALITHLLRTHGMFEEGV